MESMVSCCALSLIVSEVTVWRMSAGVEDRMSVIWEKGVVSQLCVYL